jgi:hypothetical protein
MNARIGVRLGQATLAVVCIVGLTFGFLLSWESSATLLPTVVYAAIGFLVTARKPSNPIGWLFLSVGATSGLIAAANAAIVLAERSGQPDVWYGILAGWAANFLWIDDLTLAVILTLLLFPHGLLTPRWRPVLWLTVGSAGAATVVAALAPTVSVGTHTFPNPLHPGEWEAVVNGLWTVLLAVLSVCGLLALLSTILRFRRAAGVERVQMRWFAFAGILLLVTLFVPGLNGNDIVFAVTLSLVPISCGIAIMRYHLYDIDRIISRTTSYAIVTGLVLATYATIVGTASRLLQTDSPLLVAAGTLAAAAVARPALLRVQTLVDRRFNRSRYDAVRTMEAFGARLRNEVDPYQVREDLVTVVNATLQPEHLTVWLTSQT